MRCRSMPRRRCRCCSRRSSATARRPRPGTRCSSSRPGTRSRSPLAGPHALLTFFSICAGLADGALASTADAPVPAEIGAAALELLQRLDAVAVAELRREPHRDARGDGDAACRRLLPARLRLRQLHARRTRARERAALRRRAAARLGARRHGHRDHAALRAHARARAPSHLAARRRHAGELHRDARGPAVGARRLAGRGARRARRRLLLGHAPHDRGGLGAPALRGLHRVPGARLRAHPRGARRARPGPRLLDRLGALWRAALPTGAAL